MSDNSFVCQKKNHFQITSHIGISGDPKYVRTTEGVKKIDHFCIHFYGIKVCTQIFVSNLISCEKTTTYYKFKITL